ncbi:hypothetical protein Kpol_2001p4 [Vanderwaltozyma polyspora DSM 70294]|uniref:Uncharacterized protein n=1 Tax=Vanderwaltozyma polyspora (strain ATCC 22028 / DSM 70294 / BCRC 21397 / CBS 2163 / NBRC 10782 / NRRL Y-8283 / UCD 57-17) TaxID=436907 RepID=A7TGP0_VANPO|nr:uncharacterized protein Kpol_2001p4 [Vanderwaltozyma polyspora DSM 70294]EDO18503.1 hypothetical protein Kpol_2001p4 [Vanderwaltozyma polyspora DSM 70294]
MIESEKNQHIPIEYESMPNESPLHYQMVAGAFAGIMEHSVMFPVDTIKTKIQAAPSMQIAVGGTGTSTATAIHSARYSSATVLGSLYNVIKLEGASSLWKGIQPILLGAGPAHAVYFGAYEYLKTVLIDENDTSKYHPLKVALSGFVATVASDAVMTPIDTIKQRMQLESASKFWYTTKSISKNEGLKAFFYSYPTTVAMDVPFSILNFVIYDSSMQFFNPSHIYNPYIHCGCGALSGGIAAIVTTPLDCIKTVLQVRGSKKISMQAFKEADSFSKAAKAIYTTYGWTGFFRGLRPRVVANVPATAISWSSYELAKHLLLPPSSRLS